MDMLKSKIKSSFKFFFVFSAFNFVFSQAIFLESNSKIFFSLSSLYLKQEIPTLYKSNFDIRAIIKGKYELSIGYGDSKEKPVEMNDFHRSNEVLFYELKYFFNKTKFKYAISLKSQIGINSNKLKNTNSFKVLFGRKFDGSFNSGMNYYPYIEYEYPLHTSLRGITNQEQIDNENSLYKFLYLGCYITYKKLWFEPTFKYSINKSARHNGIRIGIWNSY